MSYSSEEQPFFQYLKPMSQPRPDQVPGGCGAFFYILGFAGVLAFTAPYSMKALGFIVHTGAWIINFAVLLVLLLLARWLWSLFKVQRINAQALRLRQAQQKQQATRLTTTTASVPGEQIEVLETRTEPKTLH